MMSSFFAVRLDEAVLSDAGGKALALARAAQAGFPVPPGLVILPEAFGVEGLTDAAWASIQRQLAVWRQRQPNITFAVRSSGGSEDSAVAAFAGEFVTILNVSSDEAVLRSINTVHASYESATAYRKARGLGSLGGMAVIVQALIPADCSGVCFSVDPVQLGNGQLIITAAWGLGSGVVDGVVPADAYWLRRRDLSLEKQYIAPKTRQIVPTGEEGVVEKAVPAHQHYLPCLPEAWLTPIAQFALALEQLFGYPQDVEWAIAGRQIWLLQSRPITTLPPALAPVPFPITWEEDERRHLWSLDPYSREKPPLLPLEIAYWTTREESREETCRFLGAERNQEVRFWNGRPYFRPIPLKLTYADMQLRRAAHKDLQVRLQSQRWTAWDYWGPEVEQAVARLRTFDPETANGPALADHLENTLALLRRNIFIHASIWFKPSQAYFDAFAAVSGLTDQAAEAAAYQLLEGEENMLTRLVDGLYELAAIARTQPAVVALLTDPPPGVMARLAALPEAAAFVRQFNEFLASYGERTGEGYGSEMTILTPTWCEAPEQPLRLVAAYLDPASEPPAMIRARVQKAVDEQVETWCAGCEDAVAVAEFRRQLAYARRSLAVLEDHNYWIEQASGGQLRLAIMAAAGWLTSHGELTQPDEVFWLTFAEIVAALRGEIAHSLAAAISVRRAHYAEWVKLEPPPVVGLPKAQLPVRSTSVGSESHPALKAVTTSQSKKEERLYGIGASAGQVQASAWVVPKGVVPINLKPGSILVAANAGPVWTPLFPLLGGLVLEEGSPGQHAAVTAREYGLPAVIGCRDATRYIPDGAAIQIDGGAGTVEILGKGSGNG